MKYKNENGYTLIAVLLIMTIFMMLAFTFMGQAANSIKQNKAVEIRTQSVALSEMGVTYFQQAIYNVYETYHDPIIQQVKETREKDKVKKQEDEYIQLAIDAMRDKLKTELNSTTVSIDGKTGASFEIEYDKDLNINQIGKILKVDFNSIGTENGKSTQIQAVMNIDFSNLLSLDENGSGNQGDGNSNLLTGNKIADPGNLNSCSNNNKKIDYSNISCQVIGSDSYGNNDKLTFNNSIFKVTGSLSIPQMNSDIINSTIYVMGSMTTGNMNNLNRLRLHVDGSGHFGHFNGNGLSNSIIEIAGNAKFDNMKISKSTIYVGEYNAEFGQINGMEESTIFVNSDAVIKGLDIGKNSIVCVNGYLKIENNLNSNFNGKVYAKDSNRSNVVKGDKAFENGGACSATTGISWGDPSIFAEYDYSY